MQILRGAPALSLFKRKQLIQQLQQICPEVEDVYAEFVHFAQWQDSYSQLDHDVLNRLLRYGPRVEPETFSGHRVIVIPRPGTLSPWSTKATDIAHNCGLSGLTRIERGIDYDIRLSQPVDDVLPHWLKRRYLIA